MYRKKCFLSLTGFTLLEILIVVVIVGILASLAIPRYQKSVESSKAAEAYANLNALREAEWVHHGRTGVFVTQSNFNDLAIENPMNVPLPQRKFNYTAFLSSTGPGQDTFYIDANRNSGFYSGDYIRIYANGTMDETHWLTH